MQFPEKTSERISQGFLEEILGGVYKEIPRILNEMSRRIKKNSMEELLKKSLQKLLKFLRSP